METIYSILVIVGMIVGFFLGWIARGKRKC